MAFSRDSRVAPNPSYGIQGDLHLITDRALNVSVEVRELALWNDTLGFQTCIDDHVVIIDGDNGANNDGAGLEVGVGEALFKEFGKAFRHLMIPDPH